jgi:hypothetical protein
VWQPCDVARRATGEVAVTILAALEARGRLTGTLRACTAPGDLVLRAVRDDWTYDIDLEVDERGRFVTRELPVGAYELAFDSRSGTAPLLWLGVHCVGAGALTEVGVCDFTSGTLRWALATTTRRVAAWLCDERGGVVRLSGFEGTRRLRPGRYELRAQGGVAVAPREATFEVAAGEIVERTFALVPAPMRQLVLTDPRRPRRPVRVRLTDAGGREVLDQRAMPAVDGRVALRLELPCGRYGLDVVEHDGARWSAVLQSGEHRLPAADPRAALR